jgi:DNA-binding PadR family transcriptional regulator
MVIKIPQKACSKEITQEIVINSTSQGHQTKRELRKINQRIVKHFLDLIILNQSKKGSITGYSVMTYVNENFDIMLSPGTVYSTIYSLERQNCLVGNHVGEKRCYSITETGQQRIETYVSLKNEIIDLIKNLVQ